jgi:hypothetical protein
MFKVTAEIYPLNFISLTASTILWVQDFSTIKHLVALTPEDTLCLLEWRTYNIHSTYLLICSFTYLFSLRRLRSHSTVEELISGTDTTLSEDINTSLPLFTYVTYTHKIFRYFFRYFWNQRYSSRTNC